VGDPRSRAVGAGCPKPAHPDHAEPGHQLPAPTSAVGGLTGLLLKWRTHSSRDTSRSPAPTSLAVTCPVISSPSPDPMTT
jgi:hypothetical protein